MKINRNLSQMRAEVLLNYLYPEMESQWIAQNKGTFYRNYNQDALAVYEKEGKVQLARDGFIRMLPEGLLTKDDDLKGEDFTSKYQELEWRKELLNEAFSPFDTYVFRKKLTIERHTSSLLNEKLSFLLNSYFGINLDEETNPLVKEAAAILPFVCQFRGNLGFVANLLGTLMGCEVEMKKGRYSNIDTARCWVPRVTYELLIPGLTKEEYIKRLDELKPLVAFLKEWLIPFDVRCEVNIREHEAILPIGMGAILDYNTELNQ